MSSDQTNNAASELAKLQARSNLLLALYTHVAHDLEQTQRERDQLRDELSAVQGEQAKQHAALLRSTSWRLTAPIRALGRMLKRAP